MQHVAAIKDQLLHSPLWNLASFFYIPSPTTNYILHLECSYHSLDPKPISSHIFCTKGSPGNLSCMVYLAAWLAAGTHFCAQSERNRPTRTHGRVVRCLASGVGRVHRPRGTWRGDKHACWLLATAWSSIPLQSSPLSLLHLSPLSSSHEQHACKSNYNITRSLSSSFSQCNKHHRSSTRMVDL
jgi:hypothetical protein